MGFTIEQLDFLGVHVGIPIPPDFVENKKRQKLYQDRRAKFESEHADLTGVYAAEGVREALAKAEELVKAGKDFAGAIVQMDRADLLVKLPPPPTLPPPPQAQEAQPVASQAAPDQKQDEPPPDIEALKKTLAEAEKAVEESLADLKTFDAGIAAAKDKIKPVAALNAKYPKLGFDADEKRMTDLIARAVKANSEQPAILKQLQAEVASGKDVIAKADPAQLKALAGNLPDITRNARAAAKTVSAASRMLGNIDAGVKFVQNSAAEADKLNARLKAISIPAVEDMLARSALAPLIDRSGAETGQKEILKQMVLAVNMPAPKIAKQIAGCKNEKKTKAVLEKLRKTGNSSDTQRAVLAQCHSLVNDVFRLYRELPTFTGTLDATAKKDFETIRQLTNTEYTLGMVASVEASDDAKDVKGPAKGKKIEKKEDLLTPDAKLKSKLVGVMGGGPVGLLAAIETAMRGGKVLMYEARGGDTGKELYNRLNTIVLVDGTIQRLKKVGVWKDVFAKMDQLAHAIPVGALETILLARAQSLAVKFNEGKTVKDAVRSKDGKTVSLTVDGEKKPVIVELLVVAAGAAFARAGDKVSMAEKFGFEVVKADAKDYAVTGVFEPGSKDRGGNATEKTGWGYGFQAPDVSYLLSGLSEKEYGELTKDPSKLEAFVRQAAVNQKIGDRDFKKGPSGSEVKPAAFPIEVQQSQNMASKTSGAVLVGDSAATPHPSTGLGLNTGAREVDAISDLVGSAGDQDEALAAYDWETNRNTNVMVAKAMSAMATGALTRCSSSLKKLKQALDSLNTPLALQIKGMAQTSYDKVAVPLSEAAKKDDGADNWKLASTNIKRMREIEEHLLAIVDLTKPGAKLVDAIDILDGINGTKTQAVSS